MQFCYLRDVYLGKPELLFSHGGRLRFRIGYSSRRDLASFSNDNDNDKMVYLTHILQFILYVYVSTIDLRMIVLPLLLDHLDLRA